VSVKLKYILVCLLISLNIFSQNENSKWFFGDHAGLDFMPSPPTALSSTMVAQSGASIADNTGSLLFYTDGKKIYTSAHTLMSNGVLYNSSSNGVGYQGVIIIKKPGSSSIYYVFSGASNAGSLLSYAVVDMSMSGGLGAVTSNINLFNLYCGYKLALTRHANGIDFWVIFRNWCYGLGDFHSILVTAAGVSTAVVTSPGFTNSAVTDCQMKISPKGDKLIEARKEFGATLYDFNSTTGGVSNSFQIVSAGSAGSSEYWGAEFSPDGSKLFVSDRYIGIYQLNLCAGSSTAILASSVLVANGTNYWSMQTAPNHKIYVASYLSGSLSVINNPNATGSTCNFSANAVSLFPNFSREGLPYFLNSPQTPTTQPFSFNLGSAAGCQPVAFSGQQILQSNSSTCAAASLSVGSLQWNFGDPSSGAANTTTVTNPVHTYTAMGSYTVSLMVQYCCGAGVDTVRSVINILNPCFLVNSNTITCASLGTATVFPLSGNTAYSYTWLPSNQTGSTATGLNPGTHTVLIYNQTNSTSLTHTVNFVSPVLLTAMLSSQTNLFCNAASNGTASYANIQGGSATQNYWWSNGTNTFTSTAPTMTTLSAGNWSATVTDALTGCQVSDVFMVLQPPAQTVNIAASSPTTCAGTSISFTASTTGGTGQGYSYSWTNSNNSVSVRVQSVAGTYNYTVTSFDGNNCAQPATVSVDFVPNPTLVVSSVSICPLQTGTLSASGASNYTWSVNSNSLSNSNSWADSPSVTTVYSIDGEALGCVSSVTAAIILKTVPAPIFNNNSPLCAGQTLMLYGSGGVSYSWDGPQGYSNVGSPVSMALVTINHSGVYNLTVTAANNCTASASRTIIVKPLPTLLATASGSAVCLNASTVSLYATGTATVFNWSPGSGLSSTSGASVNASPLAAKVYTVTGSLNGCTVAQTLAVAVVSPPSLTISLSSPSLCAQALNGSPNTITLTAGGANTYTLNTPSHIVSNTGPPVSNISTQPPYTSGPATATLFGSNGVCTVTAPVIFFVIPNPTVSVSNPTPVICAGQTYTYTSQGASSYTWGSSTPGSTLYTSPGVAVASPSINSVFSVFGGSLGCASASHVFSITVNPLPTLSVTPSATAICTGSAAVFKAYGTGTSYQWSPPSFLNTASGPTVVSTPMKDQGYTVIAALNNCTAAVTASVMLLPLPLPTIISSAKEVCVYGEIVLIGTSGVGYQWKGPMDFYAEGDKITIKAGSIYSGGIYTLVATDIHNCVGSTSTSLTVHGLPFANLTVKQWEGCVPFCTGVKFDLSNTSSSLSFMSWQVDGITHTSDFKVCVTTPGDHVIYGSLIDNNNCRSNPTFTIRGLPKPVAAFDYEPKRPVENFDPVTFTSSGNDVVKWEWRMISNSWSNSNASTGSAASGGNENASMTYLFEDAGTYPVVLITHNIYGCSDTLIKPITIEPDFVIYVPNAFTPNEDNKNETFIPVTRGLKKFQLYVYDRFGHLMFSSADSSTGWDGTNNGEPCKQDVYAWKVIVSSAAGEMKTLSGHVTLYR
jgi:gliding motility-associated-like protein